MKPVKTALLYVLPLVALSLVIAAVFKAGKGLERVALVPVSNSSTQLMDTIMGSFNHPLAVFIFQMVLIIVASQLFGSLFKKIGQPAVMGEIVAGIVLGPSLLGALCPQFSGFVFPAASMGNLQMLSQVGLILFMFVIGMELDVATLKHGAGAAMLISYFSIVLPFGLGVGLSYMLYSRFAPPNVPFYAFSLFMGIALSITAFPVLARIIRERAITGTRLGTMAITAAAAGDLAAWCMLAFIVAIVKAGSVASSLYTVGAAAVYITIMLLVVRPLLNKLASRQNPSKAMKRSALSVIFVVLLPSSYCCEVIGIHALFGAFFAGAIMPVQWNFRKLLIDKIEDVALVLLLPLFFVFTGLRTQIGLINGPSLWSACGLIIAAAVIGKTGGSFLAARIAGEDMKHSISISALMNTRGLVELVVLNIGYDLKIISPQMFTMMVLMALVTTFMTNPILNIVDRVYRS